MSNYLAIDFIQLTADIGVDFITERQALLALYADIDARNLRNTSNLNLPCQAGCDACCHECVFLTPLEFMVMWDWAQSHLNPKQRDSIISEALNLYEHHRPVILAFDAPPPGNTIDHTLIARELHFRCPLLDSKGNCLVYIVRELYARLFGCSFYESGGVYGCQKVGKHLADKVVTLVSVERARARLANLPLTGKRQVIPYYFQMFFGSDTYA
ncbi:MAG: hypothetical protein JW841_05135 [Deltaproteobacteria bacterium]|nr:hypothetical protein [Deltaproteobacteria bacterium]